MRLVQVTLAAAALVGSNALPEPAAHDVMAATETSIEVRVDPRFELFNPVVHVHLAAFSGSSPMLEAAAPAMGQQHYTTLEIVIDESIVRALTVLYLRDEVDVAAANASLAQQQQLGFSWMPALVHALDASRSVNGGLWSDAELIAVAGSVLNADER